MVKSTISAVVTALVLVVVSACSRASHDECQKADQSGTLSVAGQIDVKMAQYVAQQIAARPIRSVVISSLGGEDESAVVIGTLLQRHHLSIVVNRACASACASYIFLAAPTRFVCPHAVVMFHHTANSLVKLARNSPSLRTRALYRWISDQGESLLKQNRISPMLLLQPQLEIRTTCYKYRENTEEGADIGYEAEFSLWIPSKEFMERSGVPIEGYWPNSANQVMEDLHADFRSLKAGIIFGGRSGPLSQKALDVEYSKVPLCNS